MCHLQNELVPLNGRITMSTQTSYIINENEFSPMCNVFCVLSVCMSEADVVFILDSSGSLDEPNFNHIKNFASSVVSDLDVDSGKIRVGAITYSDYAEPRFNLNQYNTRYAV